MPVESFPNVVPLEKQAGEHVEQVDTPDTAPPADAAEQGLTQTKAPAPSPQPPTPTPPKTSEAAPVSSPVLAPTHADASPGAH